MRCLLAVIFVVAVPHQLLAAEAKGGDADAFNTEHIFGFVDGSDIGEKGEKEIETETVGRFGRIGAYANTATETSFRYTATDTLRISFGTLSDYYNIHNIPGFADRTAATFSGVIGEVRVNVLNHQTSPFGLSISLNPQVRQFDPDSGARARNYAIPLTFLADRELIPQTFVIGASFAYGPLFERVGAGWQHDDTLTATAAGSYQIVKSLFLAAEMLANGMAPAHALYVGPSFLYQITPDMDFKIAWAVQIPDVGARGLDLSTYDRHQILLHFAYSF